MNDRSHSETCGEVMSGEVKSNEVEERSNKESIDKESIDKVLISIDKGFAGSIIGMIMQRLNLPTIIISIIAIIIEPLRVGRFAVA